MPGEDLWRGLQLVWRSCQTYGHLTYTEKERLNDDSDRLVRA